MGEFGDLVSGVVDVKFLPGRAAAAGENIGQRVAQYAAAGVAHMHGAGGICGNEFHHNLLSRQRLGRTVVCAFRFYGGQNVAVPAVADGEIQKAGAGDLYFFKIRAAQVQMVAQNLCQIPGAHAQRLGAGQREIRGVIAVAAVLGHFYTAANLTLRCAEKALFHGARIAGGHQLCNLVFGILNHIGHLFYHPLPFFTFCFSASAAVF